MRLKDQFDHLVKCYLPEDGILHSLPPAVKELTKVKPEDKRYNLEDSSSDEDQDYIPGNEESVVGSSEESMIEDDYLESLQDSSLNQSIADEGSPTKSPAAQVSESFINGSQIYVGTSHPKIIGVNSDLSLQHNYEAIPDTDSINYTGTFLLTPGSPGDNENSLTQCQDFSPAPFSTLSLPDTLRKPPTTIKGKTIVKLTMQC